MEKLSYGNLLRKR